jgi:hypothetical protein
MQKQLRRLATDPHNLPWTAWEADLARRMEGPLIASYIEAARQEGKKKGVDWDDDEIRALAKAWVLGYVLVLAREITGSTQTMGVVALRRSEMEGTPLADELAGTFSRGRAESVGVTETTRTFVVGQRAAVDRFVSQRTQELALEMGTGKPTPQPPLVVPYWITSGKKNMCPICIPLNGLPEDEWPHAFRDGPPSPHPHCQCDLDWRVMPSQN